MSLKEYQSFSHSLYKYYNSFKSQEAEHNTEYWYSL